ncbi:MAG: M48 family metalloprotease [Alphaproteobacteria bacterium]|nr:M48 family metalloprotease [Alphaproteobacteria bacterium]
MELTRRHFCGLSCSALALGATGCAINPATGQRNLMLMSPQDERQRGAELHPEVVKEFGGVYDDTRVTQYVAVLGGRLAKATELPDQNYTFTVLDSPVVNAFALPGGYVYITRGLMALAGDEAELAGVLGHELGHVVARHAAQRYSRGLIVGGIAGLLGAVTGSETVGDIAAGIGSLTFVQPFSREQELEADRLGVRYISRAGYDPGAMTSFLAKMRENSRLEARIAGRNPDEADARDIMSTHPRTADRVRHAMQLAGATAGSGTLDRDRYLDRIDRMIYGDSPHHGFARGRLFVHPIERYRFEVPDGFRLKSLPGAAVAASPAKMLIQFDAAEKPYGGSMTGYIAEEWASELTVEELASTTVNGLAAATAKTTMDTRSGTIDLRLAAIRFDARHIYRFIAIAPRESAAQLPAALRETLFSFRPISRREAEAARPWLIHVVQARSGDTVYGLSHRSPFESLQQERFLVMNGLGANQPLPAGARVKLVLGQ